MGRLYQNDIRKIEIYDIIVFLFILSLFIFENETYSNLFSIIQLIFVSYTIINVLYNMKIKLNGIYIWFLLVLLVAYLLLIFNNLTISNSISNVNSTFYIMTKNCIRCICLLIYLLDNIEIRTKKIICFLILAGSLCALNLCLDYFKDGGIQYTDIKYASISRVGADIAGGNVNIVAQNLSFTFLPCLYLCEKSSSKFKKILFGFIMAFIFISSLLTGTRKTLFFYIITFILFLLMGKKNKFKKIAYIVLILSITYWSLLNIEPLYYLIGHKIDVFRGNSYYLMYEGSDNIRKRLISGGITLFFNNPFGIGFGASTSYLGEYAHNNFVEILISGGLIGFLIYYSLYAYILIKSNTLKKNDLLSKYIYISLIGLLILEIGQVTYLYTVPLYFLTFSGTYCIKKNNDQKKGTHYEV